MKKVSLYFLCTVVLCLWVFFSVQNTFAQESRSLVAQKMIANILLATDNGNDHVALVERYYLVEDMLTREDISSTVRKNSQQVVSFLREYIDQKKQKTHKESTIAYAIFYDEHITNVTSSGVDLPQRCFEYYDLVDDVAWSKDIPTNLVIATWMMEASCGFYFPANGDGPFQMLYKNETGIMTVPLFVNEIQDFADFSFNKWVWYKNANTKSGLIVDLSYSRWSLDDLVKHGALYNGLANANIRGNIAPANPDYVWGRYNQTYSGSIKDGLLVNFLKMSNR